MTRKPVVRSRARRWLIARRAGHPNRHDVALPSPAIVIAKRAMAVIYKFLSEFGMTLHPKCASKDCRPTCLITPSHDCKPRASAG